MSKECVLSPQRLIVQQAIDFLTLYISPLLIGGQWRLLSGKEGVCGFKPLVLIASTICLAHMTHCQGILSTHTFKHAFMHIHAHTKVQDGIFLQNLLISVPLLLLDQADLSESYSCA